MQMTEYELNTIYMLQSNDPGVYHTSLAEYLQDGWEVIMASTDEEQDVKLTLQREVTPTMVEVEESELAKLKAAQSLLHAIMGTDRWDTLRRAHRDAWLGLLPRISGVTSQNNEMMYKYFLSGKYPNFEDVDDVSSID
jgi:hypothetical protein